MSPAQDGVEEEVTYVLGCVIVSSRCRENKLLQILW